CELSKPMRQNLSYGGG
ncbi:ABC transporter family protein, partial [Vibrio parahaemolyticus EKP-021]